MIVHGGINNLGKALDDVQCFDVITNTWVQIEVIPESFNKYIEGDKVNLVDIRDDLGPGALYHQKCTPVFYEQRAEFWEYFCNNHCLMDYSEDPLLKMPELNWGEINNYIAREGFYFFGGRTDFGDLNGDVWCLKIKNKIQVKVAQRLIASKNKEKNQRLGISTGDLTHAYFQWEKIETSGEGP